jgi:hypothetical protein
MKKSQVSNRFRAEVSLAAPRSGTEEVKPLQRWINMQHSGTTYAPDKISKEHSDAHWALYRLRIMKVDIEIDKDGQFHPVGVSIDGNEYKLTRKNK